MTRDDAEQLARRIVNGWRSTPPITEWREVLADRDRATTEAALDTLRDRVDTWLSCAALVAAYDAEMTRRSTAQRRRHPRPDCPYCDGTGFEDGPVEYETIGGEPHPYTTVIQCRCTHIRQQTPPAPATLEF